MAPPPTARPHVAIIGTRGYPSFYGGFETAVRRLAPYLVDHGWDVTVYGRKGTTTGDGDPRVSTVVTGGLNTKSISTLTYGLTATAHAARRRPDVALVMNVANGYFLPLLRARRIPSLVNVDGIEWDRAKWGRLAKAVFHTGARWTARFGDRMVYDSVEIARRWREEFGLDGEFIPYGGDPVDARDVEPGLTRRGYVLVVARLVPENTIPEFVDAAARLSERWPIVIVGSSGFGGELEERVAQLDRDHENVTWLGHLSDDRRLFALWTNAGAYFHGHSVGGTNPALVQAMAAGVPIVARDTPYNREVLDDAGVLAAADPDSIVAAIDALMDDPDRQGALSGRARERAAAHYSWESVCAAYERALRALVEDRAR